MPLADVANLKPGMPTYGVKRPLVFLYDEPEARGYPRAIDPLTGKSKWAVPLQGPNFAGTLVTAGGLVFTGKLTGEFIALDAETGKTLWRVPDLAGIVGQPITWERDGKQYVTVTSGGDRALRDACGRSQSGQRPGRRRGVDVQAVRGICRAAARGLGELSRQGSITRQARAG